MKIPFLDLSTVDHTLVTDIDKTIKKVVKHGRFILDNEVSSFEKEFARYCGVKYCIGVGNGMDALELMLRAYSIGPGDEVIVPANTYIATVLVVSLVGAIPIGVEPDLNTYNLDPTKLEAAITKKTKAVMAVDLYGQCANMRAITKICNKHKLLLFEDAAQAHGATHFGKKAGSLGNAAGWSFYPTKNLGAYGDGGAVTTNDKKVFEYVKLARNYGSDVKYYNKIKGFNTRLDELQAAILRVKLQRLDMLNKHRQRIANYYTTHLNPGQNKNFILPTVLEGNGHVWHVFVVRTKKRKQFIDYMQKKGIGTLIYYPLPYYKQKAYEEFIGKQSQFPISNVISVENVSLPISPYLKQNEVQYIVKTVNSFIDIYL